jgi:hypothetical protein
LRDQDNGAHELVLAQRILELSEGPKSLEKRTEIVLTALKVLVALGVRAGDASPYGKLVFPANYFQVYPLNLRALHYHAQHTWAKLPIKELCRWLFTHWGIEAHLRVALRKLRGQSQATFRIRPSDQGFEVIEPPQPAPTSPRFNQAVRILKDLKALEESPQGGLDLTSVGQELLELA